MELYENIIKNTIELLVPYSPLSLEVSKDITWETVERNELILKKDAAFELGEAISQQLTINVLLQQKRLFQRMKYYYMVKMLMK